MTTKKHESILLPSRLKREQLDDDLFLILEDHLKGVGHGILRARLEALCNDEKQGGKTALQLYHEAHLSKKNADKLKKLLCCEKINFNEPDTLFGWIKALSQANYGHRHLEDFYHLVKSVKPRKNWVAPLLFTTISTALGSAYLTVTPKHMRAVERFLDKTLPVIQTFLSKTFSVLKNIPLVLLIYSVLCIPKPLFYSLYQNHLRSNTKRLQKWLADTLPPVLNLVSYTLCYLAKGVFTPLAVGFFIASSLVGLINSLINFKQLGALGKKPEKTATLENQLNHLRQAERYSRTSQTVAINLAASILTSTTVILWGIFPPSFLMTLSAICFLSLVDFTKNAILNRIHTKGAESLQNALYETYRSNQPIRSEITTEETQTNLVSEIQTLKNEIKELNATKISQVGFFSNASNNPSIGRRAETLTAVATTTSCSPP